MASQDTVALDSAAMDSQRQRRLHVAVKVLSFIAVVGGTIAVAGLIVLLPVDVWLGRVGHWMRAAGPVGVALYGGLYVIGTLLFVPAMLMIALAGVAYGPLWGTLVAAPIATIAAALAFLVGRKLARRRVQTWMLSKPRFRAIDNAVGRQGFKIVFLIRLSPLVPYNLINYVLGLTRIRFRHYVAASFVGKLPVVFTYVSVASALTTLSRLRHEHSSGAPATAVYWAGLIATLLLAAMLTQIARSALKRNCVDIDDL